MNIRLEETAVPFQPGVSLLSSAVDIFITTNGIPVAWENSDHLVIYYDGKKALIKVKYHRTFSVVWDFSKNILKLLEKILL